MLKLKLNSKNYKSFIDYAIKTCDYASLIFEKSESSNSKYTFQEEYQLISEYIMRKENKMFHPDTGSYFENVDIVYFKLDKEMSEFFKNADNIFDWNGINLPEELCFYRDENIWFSCICHEKLLHIYNETYNDINFLKTNKIKFFYEI